ncbi:MAG: hypothetical protein HZC55_16175 [Verrucomicrobia bacterium]|nr:hypothetical protein [Verrucomicrobiota bacterium]
MTAFRPPPLPGASCRRPCGFCSHLPGLAFLTCLALFLPSVRATSVIPPSFPELVQEADAILRGRVTDIQARRAQAPDGTALIKTFVTFAIERTLKGPAPASVTLEFLGGTIGDDSLVIAGMPKFQLGTTEYVFVQRNGVQYCPLVALGHGRYRLMRDAGSGREFLARDNGLPLTSVSDVEVPLTTLPPSVRAAQSAARDRALTPAAFEAAITAELQRPTLRGRLP